MSVMSKELSAWHGIYGNGFCVQDSSAIRTITEQIHQRISETMNAKAWHEKAGISRFPSYCLSGWSGAGPVSGIRPWWNTFADTNGRPFVRCRPSSPRVVRKPFTLRPPPGRAAGRSPFLSSVQFKENACRGHAPIHSYGFASPVDTRYSCVRVTCPRVLRYSDFSKCGVLSHDADWIPGNCSTFPSTRSPSSRILFCYQCIVRFKCKGV